MKKVVLVLTAVIGFGITANAQTPNKSDGEAVWLLVLVLALIGIGIWYLYKKKRVKRVGVAQTQLNEILQDKGFSNTDLILTKGSLSSTGDFSQMTGLDHPTFNIAIGVKDGVMSFFGGGYSGVLTIKDNVVILDKNFIGKYSRLFEKIFRPKTENRIRHLFDIPISNITEIVPKQKNRDVVVLDIYEKSDKRTRLCFHYSRILNSLNIALANIILDAFGRILETESISKGKISQINEDIQDALKAGDDLLRKKIFKGLSTVVLAGAVVGGIALSNAGKDVGSRFRDKE